MKTYGQAMRAARESKRITQGELAELSGISQATLSQCECDRREPTLSTLVALADSLGISIDEYIGMDQGTGSAG